jgi:hypothetical protein
MRCVYSFEFFEEPAKRQQLQIHGPRLGVARWLAFVHNTGFWELEMRNRINWSKLGKLGKLGQLVLSFCNLVLNIHRLLE